MDFIFQYFALIAAAGAAINWVWAERRLLGQPRPLDAATTESARAILRFYFGTGIGFFLALGALQWLGHYPDPLFPIYEPMGDRWSVIAWFLAFALWAATLIGLWRPGVADVVVKLGLYRGPQMSGRTFRLLMTGVLVINACVFLALILGVWRPFVRTP